jgi:toxin ParE1/3/4
MAYKVVVTNDAKENMQEYIEYILYEKKNQQTAGSLLDDFEYTKDILAEVAESLKLCDNEKLISLPAA